VLVQWFQLYEIDPALVASVMGALGAEFAHYAVYAPSDHDVLIVASNAPLPPAPQARVFEHPALAKELRTVHVLSAGDLDARYLGNRATLEPLFESYNARANSDYFPVLDLNAARHRFTERSATGIVAMNVAAVPVLELLEPQAARRAPDPQHKGAHAFERIENTRQARYARDFLVQRSPPVPQGIPPQLQKDLELVQLRLLACREARRFDVWLHSLLRIAELVNGALPASEAAVLWTRIGASSCLHTLYDFQRRWIALFEAVGARDAPAMTRLATALLEASDNMGADAREYLLLAGMSGAIASGRPEQALALWQVQAPQLRGTLAQPVFRLLRCHARRADCAAAFTAANRD
jgi:hypothetical protein